MTNGSRSISIAHFLDVVVSASSTAANKAANAHPDTDGDQR